jgi:hypothetical protein
MLVIMTRKSGEGMFFLIIYTDAIVKVRPYFALKVGDSQAEIVKKDFLQQNQNYK